MKNTFLHDNIYFSRKVATASLPLPEMPPAMNVLLEIIKTTLPALIVFATVYYLLKRWTESQFMLQRMETQKNQSAASFPLKLQAYERLTLFCERISIPHLIFRLRSEKMTALDLRNSMMLAVQQEFEHNIAQQVYISGDLWQIIRLAKDNILASINHVFSEVDPSSDSLTFANALFRHIQEQASPTDTAQQAIRAEAAGLLQ